MSGLEDFLKRNNVKYEDLDVYRKPNRCFECNEFIPNGIFNQKTMELFWICSMNHESKVKI